MPHEDEEVSFWLRYGSGRRSHEPTEGLKVNVDFSTTGDVAKTEAEYDEHISDCSLSLSRSTDGLTSGIEANGS
jgi:hypothetical protein